MALQQVLEKKNSNKDAILSETRMLMDKKTPLQDICAYFKPTFSNRTSRYIYFLEQFTGSEIDEEYLKDYFIANYILGYNTWFQDQGFNYKMFWYNSVSALQNKTQYKNFPKINKIARDAHSHVVAHYLYIKASELQKVDIAVKSRIPLKDSGIVVPTETHFSFPLFYKTYLKDNYSSDEVSAYISETVSKLYTTTPFRNFTEALSALFKPPEDKGLKLYRLKDDDFDKLILSAIYDIIHPTINNQGTVMALDKHGIERKVLPSRMKISYDGSKEGIYDKKIIETIKSKLVAGERLENIYDELQKYFTWYLSMMMLIERYIVPDLGEEFFHNYFHNIYVDAYSNDRRWAAASFRSFWINTIPTLDDKHRIKDIPVLRRCAKEEFNELIRTYGWMPVDVRDCIKEQISHSSSPMIFPECPKKTASTIYMKYVNYLAAAPGCSSLRKYIHRVAKNILKTHPDYTVFQVSSAVFSLPVTTSHNEKGGRAWANYYPEICRAAMRVVLPLCYENTASTYLSQYVKDYNLHGPVVNYLEYMGEDIVGSYRKKELTDDEMTAVLDKAYSAFTSRRQRFVREDVGAAAFNLNHRASIRFFKVFFDYETLSGQKANTLAREYITRQQKDLFAGNRKSMTSGKEPWILYYYLRKSLLSVTVHFENIPKDICVYVQRYLKATYTPESTWIAKAPIIAETIRDMANHANIGNIDELTEDHILGWMQYAYRKGCGMRDIKNKIGILRRFYGWIGNLPENENNPMINPALNILVRNADKSITPTPVMPPEITTQINAHLDELPTYISVIVQTMEEVAGRFSDLMESRVEDLSLSPDDDNYGILYIYDHKNKKKRVSANTDEWIPVTITRHLYDKLKLYIKETQEIREEIGTDRIFVYKSFAGIECDMGSRRITDAINGLIKKYDIRTEDGKIWHFTTKQIRKTQASQAISAGAPLYQVQSMLRHSSPRTTINYYAEVNNEVILKKNTEFLRYKFSVFAPEKALRKFSPAEQRMLYVDFLQTEREVELGFCCRHAGEGDCTEITHGECDCAECPKLLTGEKYLSKWQSLADNASVRLKELKRLYSEHDIKPEEYETFKEYRIEQARLNKYLRVITAIKENRQ